ncbi:uncharacterized protein EI90DRAFT_3174744 [Cantharellus anzutake]|uniref:uncharacterized protein n=1 Tax=Cantharellus anzutake TaxID=1750568 RepID=UPI0019057EBB|nr:uncharacterized protein EI90DRAFT_3174744 [Cantharellus anzutake]KAF8335500.1 hypothetical protein EI90DRAFT_3174744 [Cantharellus anzutake]
MGKTAISMSVASTLDKQHTLAASFFWDKNQEGTGLDSISRFPSTLAQQLAAFNAEYQNSLIRQLRDPALFSSIDGSPLEKEVKAWIINPMRELGGVLSSEKGHPVILLGTIPEHEVHSILKPLSSIIDIPSAKKGPVKFSHATVKEFITGIPIGKKGYSIGLQLLWCMNGVIKRNEFGLPTELPLGDEEKWKSRNNTPAPKHVNYVLTHLFQHLDPLLLFSQESNELQREFEQFWTQKLDLVLPSRR